MFACSGAADVGKIADLSARKLTEDGVGKMSCLAGVGGRVKPLMEIAKAAEVILVIDGCPLHCGRNTLEQAGFKKFEHLCLADIGMEKGKTRATDEAVAKVANRGKTRLPQ
ncbi:putative zinc-binding protein [Planctomycetota bacterium]